MGLQIDRDQFDDDSYIRFSERLQQNLRALRKVLARPGFGQGPSTIGAELELFIINQSYHAFPINRTLLEQSMEPNLQLELDRFNIEYNSNPVSLAGCPFSALRADLDRAVANLNTLAHQQGGRVVPIGILPTLRTEDLDASMLSDLPRYRALSAGIRRLRREPFAVRIQGKETLELTCDDVVLEGVNTSFQVHVRVPPDQFAATYNAVQMVTPLAIALGANSPIFLGRCLWDETRVALFKQSIDYRSSDQAGWHRPARVSFGHGWVRHGAYELFAEAVDLFPPLLPILDEENPLDGMEGDDLPLLGELRLHQGTVWRWNRAVYDPGMGGHLRIEIRALPAGPTSLDMVASAAFLIGMALGLQRQMDDLLPAFPFSYAQYNFYRAAQQGFDAALLWPSPSYPSPREVPVSILAQELLPVAERGLTQLGVESREATQMLNVIRARIETGVTGARWQTQSLKEFERRLSRPEALSALLERYIHHLDSAQQVAEWSVTP